MRIRYNANAFDAKLDSIRPEIDYPSENAAVPGESAGMQELNARELANEVGTILIEMLQEAFRRRNTEN